MSFLSIGHTISSGRCSATAASIAAAESTTATVDVVAELGQRDPGALAEAVVRGDEEEDVERSHPLKDELQAPP